jgi:hypothetical protein
LLSKGLIKYMPRSNKNALQIIAWRAYRAHNKVMFSARWTYSSKTSSFGGSSAQSFGIAPFFAPVLLPFGWPR